ncbi:hypothetical protein CAOG_00103 [Capsaspora owczarzaki ATCC 30864]|uniref:Transmembrane protein n=1 Tax=Capsaspora owczarzaki (strain ATCC 30864) TaxID=595528 RepID=A0A0D2TZU4_CAPO3|nr:hypothetical protein CAOG_00103 [Capsaspora owczarzaki ATCC 30864]KJE88446.1 hypothetical protein CAOG_000103 [Capsaspora owczarzaki ATCC 30864]|eukprot:XP_004364974.1 hypothetical protein CAOG_00103 [Capsaspora owczarzaki ATCC 30864]
MPTRTVSLPSIESNEVTALPDAAEKTGEPNRSHEGDAERGTAFILAPGSPLLQSRDPVHRYGATDAWDTTATTTHQPDSVAGRRGRSQSAPAIESLTSNKSMCFPLPATIGAENNAPFASTPSEHPRLGPGSSASGMMIRSDKSSPASSIVRFASEPDIVPVVPKQAKHAHEAQSPTSEAPTSMPTVANDGHPALSGGVFSTARARPSTRDSGILLSAEEMRESPMSSPSSTPSRWSGLSFDSSDAINAASGFLRRTAKSRAGRWIQQSGYRFSNLILLVAAHMPNAPATVAWLLAVTTLVPSAVSIVVYGVIPLGDLDDENRFEQLAVWVFVINPLTWTFWAYLNMVVFTGCIKECRGLGKMQLYLPVIALTYIVEVAVMAVIIWLIGEFSFIGLIPIGISFMTTCCALWYFQRSTWSHLRSKQPLSFPETPSPDSLPGSNLVEGPRPREAQGPTPRADQGPASGMSDKEERWARAHLLKSSTLSQSWLDDVEIEFATSESMAHAKLNPSRDVETGDHTSSPPTQGGNPPTQEDENLSSVDPRASFASTEANANLDDDLPVDMELARESLHQAAVARRAAVYQYMKVMLAVVLFIGCLTVLVLFINIGDYVAQRVLVVMIGIVAFIFKKILLALTDPFPLESAMLISGLWVEHLPDVFITMAYPYVSEPAGTYAVFFLVSFFKNVAYLLFLTPYWFRFRIWVKDFLKNVLCCKGCHSTPGNRAIETEDPNDRGHSNNRTGYLRRQTRFFLWKVLSQMSGIIFYLSISPVLRFGVNAQSYPFAENSTHPVRGMDTDTEHQGITPRQYAYSVIFAACNFVFLVFALLFGKVIIKRKLPQHYKVITRAFVDNFMNPRYYSEVLAIIFGNCLVIVAILSLPMRIWFA